MGHKGHNRQWSRHGDDVKHQHGGHGRGPWGGGPWEGGGFGRPGHSGPPPWVADLFGLAPGNRQRGPRVRRGDVRSAILDVVRTAHEAGEEINGYQVIQQIAERSGDAWRPSPGSVYPTIQQLEDEGLVETVETGGRRSLRLTAAGTSHVDEHGDELTSVWRPFAPREGEEGEDVRDRGGFAELRPEIGQVMSAVWQVVTTGTDAQRQAAVDILVDARRRLYGVLADGDPESDD